MKETPNGHLTFLVSQMKDLERLAKRGVLVVAIDPQDWGFVLVSSGLFNARLLRERIPEKFEYLFPKNGCWLHGIFTTSSTGAAIGSPGSTPPAPAGK